MLGYLFKDKERDAVLRDFFSLYFLVLFKYNVKVRYLKVMQRVMAVQTALPLLQTKQ